MACNFAKYLPSWGISIKIICISSNEHLLFGIFVPMISYDVKLSNIQHLSDARYGAGMGCQWLGFDLQTLDVAKLEEMAAWLEGPALVGEVGQLNPEEVLPFVQSQRLAYLQIKGLAAFHQFASLGLPLIYEVDLENDSLPDVFFNLGSKVAYFLVQVPDQQSLDSHAGALETWAAQFPIILSADWTEDAALEWVQKEVLAGISLSSASEDRPGFRDFSDLMRILEALDTE